MKALPPHAISYQRTREFTEATVPASLRRRHTTKPDVWARIHVVEGSLRYRILAPAPEEFVLSPERAGIVEPGVPHEVEPLGPVRFYVEFLRCAEPDATPSIRRLERHELDRVWSIDRAERIERVYRLEGDSLRLVPERHGVRGWPPGEPERYGPLLLDCVDHGGTAWGAFAGDTLVGAAVLEGRFIGSRRDRLQLKFLHVSRSRRGTGLGGRLFEAAVERARQLGARQLYVSATPSENTVRFYRNRGFRPAAELDPALHALEPDDVHLELDLTGGEA